MLHPTPAALMTALLAARSAGDLAAATACYEPDAHVVAQPGRVLAGSEGVRAFNASAMGLPLKFHERRIVEAEGVALHLSRWTLAAEDGTASAEGVTTDVLLRQPDGSWLVAIDNPWGTEAIPSGDEG